MHPFRDGDSHSSFRRLLESTQQEIALLENDYVLKASSTELEEYFLGKVTINPLVMDIDGKYIAKERLTAIPINDFGRRIEVSGTALDIAIPYRGDKALWQVRPSTFSLSGYPEIDVRDHMIVLTYIFREGSSAESISAEIERRVRSLSEAVDSLARDVEIHNRSAADDIKKTLERKRASAANAVSTVAALGIPFKRRTEPLTYALPTKRRPSPISRPEVPKEKFAPEPVLAQEEFDFILRVLKSMATVMERDATAFAAMDEPGIRTHFLLQLNGHYEGMASGETFNAAGKTDILIRAGDRNVFIAECKFWRGEKSFDDAVTQLMGYLSWRDSKCALLIFNQTQNSTAVMNKMHEWMRGRPEYRKVLQEPNEGVARYVLVKPSDPGREIQVATMLFDVPRPT
jgi:hypothetical protein